MSAGNLSDRDFDQDRGQKSSGGGCFKGCLIGCCVLLVLGVAGGFAAYYFALKAFQVTDDPVKVNEILQETIPCAVPKGYDLKVGVKLKLGPLQITNVVMAPPNANVGKDAQPGDVNDTVILVFAMEGAGDANLREAFENQQRQNRRRGERRTLNRASEILRVGEHEYDATKTEERVDDHQYLTYHIDVSENVLLIVTGPLEKFDRKAMDELLVSMAQKTTPPKPFRPAPPTDPKLPADPKAPIDVKTAAKEPAKSLPPEKKEMPAQKELPPVKDLLPENVQPPGKELPPVKSLLPEKTPESKKELPPLKDLLPEKALPPIKEPGPSKKPVLIKEPAPSKEPPPVKDEVPAKAPTP